VKPRLERLLRMRGAEQRQLARHLGETRVLPVTIAIERNASVRAHR